MLNDACIAGMLNSKKSFLFLIHIACCFVFVLFSVGISQQTFAAEIPYVDVILKRGYLNVGIPPYSTPPFYYNDDDGNLVGYDIDVVREFAKLLGVGIRFDRQSKSFNDLVHRVGANDFDMALGKLGTTFKRMSDAYPHEYMIFRHAILANRKVIANLQGNIPDDRFAKVLMDSQISLGFIANSVYGSHADRFFPNSKKSGCKNWDACKEALFTGAVDGIYRDATEIKKILYNQPALALDYVPILFEDLIDQKSIYLSSPANLGLASMLDYYLDREYSVKTDSEIMEEYSSFYRPDKKKSTFSLTQKNK